MIPNTPQILAVDDSKLVRIQVKKAFADYEVKFVEAENGELGLSAAEFLPDLIFLDITMPVMQGDEMLVRLRENPRLSKIPVIMVSAECSQSNIIKMAKLGSNDFIKKPFQGEQLVLKAHRFLGDRLNLKKDKELKPKITKKTKSFFIFSYKYLVINIPEKVESSLKSINRLYKNRIDEAILNRLSDIFIDISPIEEPNKHLIMTIQRIKEYSDLKNMRSYIMCHKSVERALASRTVNPSKKWQFFAPNTVEVD